MRYLKKFSSPVPGMLPHRKVPGVWIASGGKSSRNIVSKQLQELKLQHNELLEKHEQLHARLSKLEENAK